MLPVIRRTKNKVGGHLATRTDQEIFHQRMMIKTIELSKIALKDPEVYEPFAALLVRNSDGRIISEGCNSVRECMDPSLHGVVVTIRHACRAIGSFDLSGCTLYSMCKPCAMCAGLIGITKINNVYFAYAGRIPSESLHEGTSSRDTDQSTIYRQILENEANKVFKAWKESELKQKRKLSAVCCQK